ncbi:MAG: TetR/AcrR family transcriptional regulator [Acidimicrobiia bacterium]|nr:TetR/AcrR family transcriptional regulator [Acidimicrobiia bacterium]
MTQEERKAETRARLLASAAALFASQGVHATSADAIAEGAGRTSGALYAHFGGKDGVLRALLDEWERDVARRTADRLDRADTTRERAGVLWEQYTAGPAPGGSDAATPAGLEPPGPRHRASAQAPADEPGAAWGLLEHEVLLQAARDAELAERVARRYQMARREMAAAFESWAGQPLEHPSASQRGTLVLAVLLGLELQRRIDPAAVPDDLAVEGLTLLIEGATAPT